MKLVPFSFAKANGVLPAAEHEGRLVLWVTKATPPAAIVEGIKAKGNKDFTVKVFPRGDHGIRARPEGSPFPFREFVPGYLETMSDWLARKKYSQN